MKRMIVASSELPNGLKDRCKKMQELVNKCYEYDTEDIYEEVSDGLVLEEPDANQPSKVWTIDKCHVQYISSYDENDKRVKVGSRVPGSTFYSIAFDGDMYDEVYFAYSSLEDAKRALQVYQQQEDVKYNKYHS